MLSTQVDPLPNLDAIDMWTAEFAFSDGAASVANARLKGHRRLGNIVEVTPITDNKKVEHKGSYRGVKRIDKTRITEANLGWKLKLDELSVSNLSFVFSGDAGSVVTQSAQTLLEGDSLDFATEPGVVGNVYAYESSAVFKRNLTELHMVADTEIAVTADAGTDLITETTHGRSSGDRIIITGGTAPTGLTKGELYFIRDVLTNTYALAATSGGAAINFTTNGTSVKVRPALIEGTDFEADLLNGEFTLLTAQTAVVRMWASFPSIADGGDNAFIPITPLTNLVREGYGRIYFYDQNDDNKMPLFHRDFSCDITVDTATSIDGEKWNEITLNVVSRDRVGIAYGRQLTS